MGRARRALLLGLMVLFAAGNVASAVPPSYGSLLLFRFVAGLPHGAFFGVASLVAVDMAPLGRAGRAVGRVMLGIPLANVVGVPAATWLGQHLGWRTAYWTLGGAWSALGGVVIDRGWGYTAPSLVGAGLSLAGLAVLGVSVWVHRRPAAAEAAGSVAVSGQSSTQ